MMIDNIIGRCPQCGKSLTNGHVCAKWIPIKETYMDKMIMLSYLRNPYGIDELELRTSRLQAANELERLYKIEKGLKDLVAKIKKHNNGV